MSKKTETLVYTPIDKKRLTTNSSEFNYLLNSIPDKVILNKIKKSLKDK